MNDPQQCPATSPESGTPCSLPDRLEDHQAGHESAWVDGSRVSWATTYEDHLRWVQRCTEEQMEQLPKNSGPGSYYDQGCKHCGRDNRYGTHKALEMGGHLSHEWEPADDDQD